MNCPDCDVMLKLAKRSEIKFDYCPRCRGAWLARDEVDRIVSCLSADGFRDQRGQGVAAGSGKRPTVMVVVCAWCGIKLDHAEGNGTSHGICSDCANKVLAECQLPRPSRSAVSRRQPLLPKEDIVANLDDQVAEVSLLLPSWQAAALEARANDQGLTIAQMLRRILSDNLERNQWEPEQMVAMTGVAVSTGP